MQLTWQFFAALLTVGGVVPFLTALLVKLNANEWVKNFVSGAIAALGAVLAYLVDLEGVPDWTAVALLAAGAWAAAGGLRKSTVIGTIEDRAAEATADVGFG